MQHGQIKNKLSKSACGLTLFIYLNKSNKAEFKLQMQLLG